MIYSLHLLSFASAQQMKQSTEGILQMQENIFKPSIWLLSKVDKESIHLNNKKSR